MTKRDAKGRMLPSPKVLKEFVTVRWPAGLAGPAVKTSVWAYSAKDARKREKAVKA